MMYHQTMRLPLTLRLPPLGYGFRVEGEHAGSQQTAYCIVDTRSARGSIKTNENHVLAAARSSAIYRFNEWNHVTATRVNIISAWWHSIPKQTPRR